MLASIKCFVENCCIRMTQANANKCNDWRCPFVELLLTPSLLQLFNMLLRALLCWWCWWLR